MWKIIIAAAFFITAAAVVYICSRLRRFPFLKRLKEKSNILSWLASLAMILPIGLLILYNVTTMLVVLLHLALFFAISDLVFLLIRKTTNREVGPTVRNLTAIIVTVVYLGIGWIMANHVFVTRYTFKTGKQTGNIRIAQIADSHVGSILDGNEFAVQMDRISSFNPDILVITGDFVDDDTPYEDMMTACNALGTVKTTYGVFYVFGNHDKGYYNSRNFTTAQLRQALEGNGVTILEDESVLVDNRFYIIGRQDRSTRDRADIADIVKNLDKTKYMIVLNHQPNDYEAEAAAEVDLVLSGHTHGGHIFPAGLFGVLSGANDRAYGTERRGDTTFVVTSGISGWAVPIKTICFSEFVIVDIIQD